ncbi:hypothetical protein T4A_11599 [Trichinella pseudospiralis]|uniref:Uncharacterized protein n=1 Tax=Trichinella pseudospiralis TaxID=6337 RepID=A0A0V1E1J4_TRIPS|nr:hypothetical protein T4A_11599 [Trichinella pseudospiralis]
MFSQCWCIVAIQFPPSVVVYDYKPCYVNTANTFYRIEENQKLLNGNCKHLSSCIENDFYAIKGNLATRYTTVKLGCTSEDIEDRTQN